MIQTSFILDYTSYGLSYFDDLLESCINRRIAYLCAKKDASNIRELYHFYKDRWLNGIKNGNMIIIYYTVAGEFKAFAEFDLNYKKDLFFAFNFLANYLTTCNIKEDVAMYMLAGLFYEWLWHNKGALVADKMWIKFDEFSKGYNIKTYTIIS